MILRLRSYEQVDAISHTVVEIIAIFHSIDLTMVESIAHTELEIWPNIKVLVAAVHTLE